jgi:hypothetical protein
MSLREYPQIDLSGGIQTVTTPLMKKPTEIVDIRNGRFDIELGAIGRRGGYTKAGSIFGAGSQNTPTGGWVAKYTTGNKRFVAVNNSGNTKTIIRVQDSGAGTWTTLSTDIPINARVFYTLWQDEVFITGYDPATGDPITPYNVDNTLTISTSHNILNMPAGYYMQEYAGALYIANVKISTTRYPDRIYKSSGPQGFITTVQAAQSGALTQITVDSTRYLKVGMAIDIYAAGTDTKLYDFTITAVDKNLNKITVATTATVNLTDVATSTDIITVGSNIPTGTAVQLSSTTTPPGGLTANTTYYAINVSSTTIKLATTSLNATNNVPINITSMGASQDFLAAAVNTGTEVITLANTTYLSTGTPITFTNSGGSLPTGLSAGTIYYAINLSSTTISVATTLANAQAGTAVNITAAGSGTHTIHSGVHTFGIYYAVSDNDEIWLDGRKGKLTIFWNTDDPTPEDADWTATLPGVDSNNAVTALAKSSNRLFVWTKNSGQVFDGANMATYNNAVGCISHNSVKNLDDDWLVWLDARGKLQARNQTNNQQEYISRGLWRSVTKYLTKSLLPYASATVVDNKYHIYLGQHNLGKGNEYIRLVYSFDDNLLTIDRLSHAALFMSSDDYTGEDRVYFFSDNGYLYYEHDGNLDDDKIIPYEFDLGEDNFGTQQLKSYDGMFVYSKNAIGTTIKASVSGGDFRTVGQITQDEEYIKFSENGDNKLPEGTTIRIKYANATKGDAPLIRGHIVYFNAREARPSERRPKKA